MTWPDYTRRWSKVFTPKSRPIFRKSSTIQSSVCWLSSRNWGRIATKFWRYQQLDVWVRNYLEAIFMGPRITIAIKRCSLRSESPKIYCIWQIDYQNLTTQHPKIDSRNRERSNTNQNRSTQNQNFLKISNVRLNEVPYRHRGHHLIWAKTMKKKYNQMRLKKCSHRQGARPNANREATLRPSWKMGTQTTILRLRILKSRLSSTR